MGLSAPDAPRTIGRFHAAARRLSGFSPVLARLSVSMKAAIASTEAHKRASPAGGQPIRAVAASEALSVRRVQPTARSGAHFGCGAGAPPEVPGGGTTFGSPVRGAGFWMPGSTSFGWMIPFDWFSSLLRF